MNEITDRELDLLEEVARDSDAMGVEWERTPEDLYERINAEGLGERIAKHIGNFIAIAGPHTMLRICARLRRVETELDAALKRERVLLHAAWVLQHQHDVCPPPSNCDACERRERAQQWLTTNTTRP